MKRNVTQSHGQRHGRQRHQTLCLLLATVALAASSCTLDDRYFDPLKVDAYELGYSVIPESRVSEVTIPSNGETLAAVFVTAATVASGAVTQAPAILYSHGNSDNIDEYWHRIEILDALGYNILIYDYQGYGKSTGEPSMAAVKQNAQDAWQYLIGRSEVKSNRLISYGYSLGGILAVHLAANVDPPRVMILEATPASSGALIKAGIEIGVPSELFFDESFSNLELAPEVGTATLLFHGRQDEEVPFKFNAQELADALPSPKQIVFVDGADHEGIIETLGESNYVKRIRDFAADHLTP